MVVIKKILSNITKTLYNKLYNQLFQGYESMWKVSAVIISIFVLIIQAQTVNLLGTITTYDGNPISGVKATLVNKGMIATTDANGVFKFPTVSGTINKASSLDMKISIHGRDRTIRFRLSKASVSSLELFDLRGALVHQIYKGTLKSGYHTFNLSKQNLSQKVYVLRIGVGSSTMHCKIVALGSDFHLSHHFPVSDKIATTSKTMNPLPQISKIVDTIRLSHPEYNDEYFTFSSYIDTFDLVLGKLNWADEYPMTNLVTVEDDTLPGWIAFDEWMPGEELKNAWLDSLMRHGLMVIYRDLSQVVPGGCENPPPNVNTYCVKNHWPKHAADGPSENTCINNLNGTKGGCNLNFPAQEWLLNCMNAGDLGKQELCGIIYHELVGHGYTNEHGGRFGEGKIDGARYWMGGFPRTNAKKTDSNYQQTYQELGFFFVWLEEEKVPQFTYKLNIFCNDSDSSDWHGWEWDRDWPVFAKQVGLDYIPIQDLWNEYQDTFENN